jgi:hypothetical protein
MKVVTESRDSRKGIPAFFLEFSLGYPITFVSALHCSYWDSRFIRLIASRKILPYS